MAVIEYIASEFASFVVGKIFDKIGYKIKSKYSEHELKDRFQNFCNDSKWQDVFENQGFQDGIDFVGLTDELKQNIVDRSYKYYHSLDLNSENLKYDKMLEELYIIARADSVMQKKQVQEIVYAAYHMTCFFYIEFLSSETLFAINSAKRYTDQKVAELRTQLENEIRHNLSSIELQDSFIEPTPVFTGRQFELIKIEQKLKAGDHIVVICGQGGIGKSELAKKFAKMHENEYATICFAYYAGSIKNTIVNSLTWSYGQWNEKTPDEQFKIKLSCLQSFTRRVLLIIDDVNQIEDYETLAKLSNRNIHIIITTRTEELIDVKPIKLSILDYEKDLLPLFKTYARIDQWDDWIVQHEPAVREIIHDILEEHTMLVILTAKLLSASGRTIEEICDSLRQNRLAPEFQDRIKSFKDADRITPGGNKTDNSLYNHVLKLFSVSRLTEEASKINILRNMSIIPYSGIKRSVFMDWTDLDDFNDIRDLVNAGWLTLSENETHISMHAIVSDAILIQTKPDVGNCNVLLNSIAQNIHVGSSGNPADKVYMIEYGKFVLKRIWQEEHITGYIANQIAFLLNFIGDYNNALEWYFKSLSINIKVLGEEHPDTAVIFNNIGAIYRNKGDYQKALEWHKKALDTREKVLGGENSDTAITYGNLAGIYECQGNYPKALEWHKKALIICEKELGREHPTTAATYNTIAGVYESMEDYVMALEWYNKALVVREKILGKGHPSTLITYNNMAGTYCLQHNFPKALELYNKAYAISEEVFGCEHPDTAAVYHNLGTVYYSIGDYTKALEWYNKALVIREKVLDREHPDTAATYDSLGRAYQILGDSQKALEWFNKALVIREKLLGQEHPVIASTYNSISGIYNSKGDYSKALEWLNKALAICEKVFGSEHPRTALIYSNLTDAYISLGEYQKAIDMNNKALIIREKILGPEHPDTADSYNNMGSIYYRQENYLMALEYSQKALDIYEKVLGPDHPDTATFYNNLATIWYSLKDYSRALELFGKAFAICKRAFGEDHPDTVLIYENIAEILYLLKR